MHIHWRIISRLYKVITSDRIVLGLNDVDRIDKMWFLCKFEDMFRFRINCDTPFTARNCLMSKRMLRRTVRRWMSELRSCEITIKGCLYGTEYSLYGHRGIFNCTILWRIHFTGCGYSISEAPYIMIQQN